VKRVGLAGAFVWSLDMDDFSGSCGYGNYPLVTAVSHSLHTDHTATLSQQRHKSSTDHLLSRQVNSMSLLSYRIIATAKRRLDLLELILSVRHVHGFVVC